MPTPITQTVPRWSDPDVPADERIDALVAEMTLAEKIAQLGSVWDGVESVSGNVAPMQDVFARHVDFEEATRNGIGHFTRPFGTRPVDSAAGSAHVVELQHRLLDNTRLRVPAIVHEECLTGFTTYGATVFPTSLAWAATFDPELIRGMAHTIGSDMRAAGVHSGLSPVLDVARDSRWGRTEETMGEDPYLVSQIGAAYVSGLEDAGIVATLKHFAGYSVSKGARNHAPVTIGPREFRDVILPPFEKAVRDAGARSVMNSYSDIDGEPAAASVKLLTDMLREEWGFEGTVVSDYWSIAFLATMHRVAADFGDAGALALTAGLDVELPDTLGFGAALRKRVENGSVPEALVDRALRRVLRQKLDLGLLDADWTPEHDIADNARDLDSPHNRELARRIAETSIVLLENEADILPLSTPPAKIALIGPSSTDPGCLFGCYSFPNHVIPKFPEFGLGVNAPSIADAIAVEWPEAELAVEHGVPLKDADRSGIAAAVAAARAADVAIVAVGDRSGLFGEGTSGEGCDVPDLALPGIQAELVEAILETGTPVILAVVSGRPYALGAFTGRCAAIVQAFFPGQEGAGALAGILSGRVNPSGRLPIQVPATTGGSPTSYLAPPYGRNSEGVSNLDPTPAFPFGHGLSYTAFHTTDLQASATEMPTDGSVEVAVTVTNVGDRAGGEVVQLYLTDPVATVTRPVRRLIGFARVDLEAGESRRIVFSVSADLSAFTGIDLKRRVEPGEIVLTAAASAADTGLTVTVTLTGDVRHVGHDRVWDTPASISVLDGPADFQVY